MKKLLFLSYVFVIFSCQKTEIKQEMPVQKLHWEELEVNTRFQKVIINRHDSCEYQNLVYSDGIYSSPPKNYKLEKTEVRKFYLSKNEKDSLAKYIFESISNPKFTDILVSDYVGNVELTFAKSNMKLKCEYRSVGDWTEVSPNTNKIYSLLNSKVKLSKW